MMSALLIFFQNQVLVNLGHKPNAIVYMHAIRKVLMQQSEVSVGSTINIDVTVDLKSYYACILYSLKCVVKLLSIHIKINLMLFKLFLRCCHVPLQ